MEQLTIKEIEEATGGALLSEDENVIIDSISTDSRTMESQTLFVPLKGETNDGHDYIDMAISNGAKAILTEKKGTFPSDVSVILVEDTTKALGMLAKYYLAKMQVKVVAVTGSVGKTSTKEMVAAVLSKKFRVVKTKGNFNNHIGLPKTVFTLTKEDEIAVLEMGMNHFGEIDYLADIAQPDVAAITNIGVSHIENLGSREGILKAKMEVDDHLKAGGKLVLNADNDLLQSVIPSVSDHVLTYSIENQSAMYVAKNIEISKGSISFSVEVSNRVYQPVIYALGEYHVYNALCALAIGRYFGMDMAEIVDGIASFENAAMRMSIEKKGDYTFIVDCYNAAPDSMEAAIKVLSDYEGERKVAVLGDMMEMGEFAPAFHEKVGHIVAQQSIDVLVTIGSRAEYIARGAISEKMRPQNIHSFLTIEEFIEAYPHIVKKSDVILLKASRAMTFEKILSYIAR